MLADAVGREGVGRDDVSTGLYILPMDAGNYFWSREVQHIVVTCQRYLPVSKWSLMISVSRQTHRLDFGAHGTVHQKDLPA